MNNKSKLPKETGNKSELPKETGGNFLRKLERIYFGPKLNAIWKTRKGFLLKTKANHVYSVHLKRMMDI